MTHTHLKPSIAQDIENKFFELLKSADLYPSKASLNIQKKTNGNPDSTKKKYPKSMGCIFGGVSSIVS
jgi:hypothetical protein